MAPLRGRSTSQEGDAHPPQATLQPDKVVASRKGEVLIKYTILKSDHFPGEHLPRCSAPCFGALCSSTDLGVPACPCLVPEVVKYRGKAAPPAPVRRLPEQEVAAAA